MTPRIWWVGFVTFVALVVAAVLWQVVRAPDAALGHYDCHPQGLCQPATWVTPDHPRWWRYAGLAGLTLLAAVWFELCRPVFQSAMAAEPRPVAVASAVRAVPSSPAPAARAQPQPPAHPPALPPGPAARPFALPPGPAPPSPAAPSRLGIGLFAGTLMVCAVVAAGLSELGIAIGTCGGDGGSPYAEPGSAAARFCAAGSSMGFVDQAVFAGSLALIMVGGIVATVQRSPRTLVRAAGGAAVLMGLALFVIPQLA